MPLASMTDIRTTGEGIATRRHFLAATAAGAHVYCPPNGDCSTGLVGNGGPMARTSFAWPST